MKLELYPVPKNASIGEIEVKVELTNEEVLKINKMDSETRNLYVKSKATVRVTDFDVDYEVPDLSEWDIYE